MLMERLFRLRGLRGLKKRVVTGLFFLCLSPVWIALALWDASEGDGAHSILNFVCFLIWFILGQFLIYEHKE